MKKVIMYADGGSRGNPGPAASAAVLKDEDGRVVAEVSKYLGETTNNQAEYTAIIIGLEKARLMGFDEVEARLDSELAVKQLTGTYRVKNPGIAQRFLEVRDSLHSFKKVSFTHVRRELNVEADALVNKCLDDQGC